MRLERRQIGRLVNEVGWAGSAGVPACEPGSLHSILITVLKGLRLGKGGQQARTPALPAVTVNPNVLSDKTKGYRIFKQWPRE